MEADQVTREHVLTCVTREMPPEAVEDVLRELDFYDDTPRWPFGDNWFRLAVLRLAAGDPSRVRPIVKTITADWRDVIAPIQEKYGRDWLAEFLVKPADNGQRTQQ